MASQPDSASASRPLCFKPKKIGTQKELLRVPDVHYVGATGDNPQTRYEKQTLVYNAMYYCETKNMKNAENDLLAHFTSPGQGGQLANIQSTSNAPPKPGFVYVLAKRPEDDDSFGKPDVKLCKGTKADGTPCTFPTQFRGYCGIHMSDKQKKDFAASKAKRAANQGGSAAKRPKKEQGGVGSAARLSSSEQSKENDDVFSAMTATADPLPFGPGDWQGVKVESP